MNYTALPLTNPGLQHFDDQDITDRDARQATNTSPFLARRASSCSVISSVSMDREADMVAPAGLPESSLLQEPNDYYTPQYPSATNGIAPPTSDDVTQASLEMQNFDQPNPPKPNRPRTSLLQLMNIWRWELCTWFLGTLGYLANLILVGISDGLLQRDWHSRIQITAFVAALAQVSQSALLVPMATSIAQLRWRWVLCANRPAIDLHRFDLASRGPDGSMRLLWHFA